jgi:hypothetical protein
MLAGAYWLIWYHILLGVQTLQLLLAIDKAIALQNYDFCLECKRFSFCRTQ